MRSLHLALIFGLCACAAGSPAAKKPIQVKDPARPTLAEISVTCDPVGSDPNPQGFGFITELKQGEPSCKDCLEMAEAIQSICQESPQYCPCLKRAFSMNCTQYIEQMRQGCKPGDPQPVSGPLVQG